MRVPKGFIELTLEGVSSQFVVRASHVITVAAAIAEQGGAALIGKSIVFIAGVGKLNIDEPCEAVAAKLASADDEEVPRASA